MKIYYYLIVMLTMIIVSCKNNKRLLPTDNSGGYIIEYLPKQLNDSLCVDITVFDLDTKKEINNGLLLHLFEDIRITNVFKIEEKNYLNDKLFFKINALGYKPIVTKPISFNKSNNIKLKVFLEPVPFNIRH